MSPDLASAKDGISERFVPDQDRGRLIEVEHLARYRFAEQLVEGRSVLDAGCGTAYGTRMLAGAGAHEIVGVDIAQPILDAVAPEMPDTVCLQAGDLRRLEFDDDRFEVVVCFEAIEHVDDWRAVLDELVRVLAPGGLLLISSPNRGVYPPDNPHHRHEFSPDELSAALGRRLRHVRLHRQHDYIVSAVLSDAELEAGGGEALDHLRLRKLAAQAPGEELYTVAAASDSELPGLSSSGELAGPLELAQWLSLFQTQTAELAERDTVINDMTARLADHDRLTARLLDTEQRLAHVPELQLRISELEGDVARARTDAADAHAELAQLDKTFMYLRRALRLVRPYIGLLKRIRRMLRSR